MVSSVYKFRNPPGRARQAIGTNQSLIHDGQYESTCRMNGPRTVRRHLSVIILMGLQ